MGSVLRRALGARTSAIVRQIEALAAGQPEWESEVHRLAGGWLILSGAGLYVNRAIGSGESVVVSSDDVDQLIGRSRALGVTPAFEVSPLTRPDSGDHLTMVGFTHDPALDTVILTRSVGENSITGGPDIRSRRVGSPGGLHRWQEVSAAGWGHTDPSTRRASDAYGAALDATDDTELFVAEDRDGRAVGCAAMTVNGDVAVLEATCTLPPDRRRGVQATLIRDRLEAARRCGCRLAAVTASAGSSSDRNLRRHGFEARAVIEVHQLR